VRSSLPPASIAAAIARLAHDTAPAPIVKFRTMASQVEDSLVRDRLMATLSGFFGGLAALIAALASYLPAQRASRLEPTEALRAE
jgi:hypothetical protein